MATRKHRPRLSPDAVITLGKATDYPPARGAQYPWDKLVADGDCFVLEGIQRTFGIRPPKAVGYSIRTYVSNDGMVVERIPKRDPLAKIKRTISTGGTSGYAELLAANPPVPGTGNVFDIFAQPLVQTSTSQADAFDPAEAGK